VKKEDIRYRTEIARLRELLKTAIEIAEWLMEGYEPQNDDEEIKLVKCAEELDNLKNKSGASF